MAKGLLLAAALILLLATGLGAYASHGLDPMLGAEARAAVQTAIQYQFYHGLAVIAAAILGDRHERAASLWVAGTLFVAGTLLFCGSIYAARLGGVDAMGGLAPVGGVCLMAGWAAFGLGVSRLRARSGR